MDKNEKALENVQEKICEKWSEKHGYELDPATIIAIITILVNLIGKCNFFESRQVKDSVFSDDLTLFQRIRLNMICRRERVDPEKLLPVLQEVVNDCDDDEISAFIEAAKLI